MAPRPLTTPLRQGLTKSLRKPLRLAVRPPPPPAQHRRCEGTSVMISLASATAPLFFVPPPGRDVPPQTTPSQPQRDRTRREGVVWAGTGKVGGHFFRGAVADPEIHGN